MVIDTLIKYSRYAVPHSILVDVAETMSRYGRLRLEADPIHGLILVTTDTAVLEDLEKNAYRFKGDVTLVAEEFIDRALNKKRKK